MRRNPGKSKLLSEPAELQALASPTRHAVFSAVLTQGEASVREIAAQLGRHPASIYKHIDHLEDVGLIREEGTRATGKRDARVFSATKQWIKYDPANEEMVNALNAFVLSELRHAGRKITESYSDGATTKGKGRDTYFGSLSGWLTRDELAELNGLLDRITELMEQKPRRPGTRLIATVANVYPLPMGSRAIDPDGE